MLILTGLAMIFYQVKATHIVILGGALLMVCQGMIQLYHLFKLIRTRRSIKDKKWQLLLILIKLALAIFILVNQTSAIYWVLKFVGIYQLMLAIFNLATYGLMFKDKARERYPRLLMGILHLAFGWDSFLASENSQPALIRLGLYLLVMGGSFLWDSYFTTIDPRREPVWRRSLRLPLPVLFSALLPQQILQQIQQLLEETAPSKDHLVTQLIQDSQVDVDERTADKVTVQIHVGPSTVDKLGHMNLIFQGKVYSYGNHDVDSRRFFELIGDGVLLIIDHEDYNVFSLRHRLTIIEYDIAISPQQAHQIEQALKEIQSMTIPWHPQSERVLKSYTGKIVRETRNPQFYKFNQGPFQTYFVFWTNCVLMTDRILEKMGLDLFPLLGIQAPGAYYDFLEREYQKANSMIIKRRIAHQGLRKAFVSKEMEKVDGA